MKWIIENTFDDFNTVRGRLKANKIQQLNIPGDKEYFISRLPKEYSDIIIHKASEITGKKLIKILDFVRLNTNRHDNGFRIHSDKAIAGNIITHACVTYLDTVPDTGTALFEHPIHGRSIPLTEPNKIFNSDDGKWIPYFKYESVANTTFVYEANYYHGRYPWKAYGTTPQDGRLVIVSFLKEA